MDVSACTDEGIWLVSFMHYDLGYFDLEQKTYVPRQPVRPEVVTHVFGIVRNPCVRYGPSANWLRGLATILIYCCP